MSVSIKRNQTEGAEDGARETPGITDGKSYPVRGFTGGGVVVLNDSDKFLHLSFSDIDAGWTVTDDAAKAKAKAKADAEAEAESEDTKTTT